MHFPWCNRILCSSTPWKELKRQWQIENDIDIEWVRWTVLHISLCCALLGHCTWLASISFHSWLKPTEPFFSCFSMYFLRNGRFVQSFLKQRRKAMKGMKARKAKKKAMKANERYEVHEDRESPAINDIFYNFSNDDFFGWLVSDWAMKAMKAMKTDEGQWRPPHFPPDTLWRPWRPMKAMKLHSIYFKLFQYIAQRWPKWHIVASHYITLRRGFKKWYRVS